MTPRPIPGHSALVTCAAALLVALGVSPALAGGAAKLNRTCDARLRGAVLVTRQVVVYSRHTGLARPPDPNSTDTFYACRRPGGGASVLGYSQFGSGGQHDSDATLSAVRAAGTYVAAEASSGEFNFFECTKFMTPQRCPSAKHWISVVDVATNRHGNVSRTNDAASSSIAVPLAISPDGAIAWLENAGSAPTTLWAATLKPQGKHGFATVRTQLDTGHVDPRSLRFDHRVLHWVRERQQRQATLG